MCSLGLNYITKMSASKTYQVIADLADWEGLTAHAPYASMYVAGGEENFNLTLGEFLGREAGKHREGFGIFYNNYMTLTDFFHIGSRSCMTPALFTEIFHRLHFCPITYGQRFDQTCHPFFCGVTGLNNK